MDLPKSVRLMEVGPRDGLQNLPDFVPTATKIELIERFIAAGIREIELSSFVHPKAIPQMADAAEVVKAIVGKYGNSPPFRFNALVPNVRGAENAAKSGLDMVCVVISASEAHNKANINRTIGESVEGLKEIIAAFPALTVRLDVATAFGCPFAGPVAPEKVLSLIDSGVEAGVDEIVLCDTIGVADPLGLETLVRLVSKRYPGVPLTLHLHDTRGMGLANILAGMQNGIEAFETSIGGLGGCPFAPGAAGNTATEDAAGMIAGMGIETGIDMAKLYDALFFVRDNIKRDLGFSHLLRVAPNPHF